MKCNDCNDSGVVKVGAGEYQKCPCMEKTRGGARKGAGRKPKEPTKTIRVPVRLIPEIMKLIGK